MRALHVSKSSDGAQWAIRQVKELVRQSVEVHVALPNPIGEAVPAWQKTGATLHFVDCSLPLQKPGKFMKMASELRDLIARVNPDIIHSHHVSTTAMFRLVLGKKHPIPRLFQVPGPLHLEHWHSRQFEMSLAGEHDYWVASSKYIKQLYDCNRTPADKLFMSYHSADTNLFSAQRSGYLNNKLSIPHDATLIGNINLIYQPKRHLGHRVGIKCHEDVIEAIRLVQKKHDGVVGILVGGTFQGRCGYEARLKAIAKEKGAGRILMPGKFNSEEVAHSWPDFDCAVHVPFSENCGGVTEPLLCEVPTIASEVGGLPEVIHKEATGQLVPARNPKLLANAILNVLRNPRDYKCMAQRGRRLVKTMFEPKRCANEIVSIYRHVLFKDARPSEFDARHFVEALALQETSSASPETIATFAGW